MSSIFQSGQTSDLFPAFFENAAASMAVTLIDGTHLKVNRAFCEFLGYSEAELLQLKVLDITHPEDRDFTAAQFQAASERQQSTFHYEKRYQHKCGNVVWGLVSASWVLKGPEPPYCLVLIQDITARKESERALRESEELYRMLVENTDLGINLIGEDRRILKVNAATSRRLSKPAESLVGMECFREFEKRDKVCDNCPGILSMATGRSEKLVTEGTWDDGSRYVLRLHTFPVRDADGQARKFVEVVEDITERIKVRDALRESEKRFRSIFENADAGICTIGLDWRFLQVNQAFCEFLGYSEEELLGMTLNDVTHPEDLDLTRNVVHTALAGPSFSFRYEKRYRHKDGSTLWAQVSSGWQLDEAGRPAYAIGMVLDITERKRAEEALLESRNRFKTLVENIPGTVYRCEIDFPWRMDHISGSVRGITGVDAEKFIDGSVKYGDFVHPDDLGHLEQMVAEGVLNHRSYEIQYRVRHADGVDRWVLERGQAIYDTDSQPLWLDGVILDITERVNAENSLRESERALRSAQKIARIGSYIYDIPGDWWTSSAALDEIFGIDAAFQRTANDWAQLLHPDCRAEMLGRMRQAIKRRRRFEMECRIIRANDGEERWVLDLGEIECDANGEPLRFIGTVQDITERKAAEGQLLLRTRAIEATGNGIMVCDASLTALPIVYVNPAFERITGYTSAETLGRSPNFLSREDAGQSEVVEITALLRRHAEAGIELRKYRKDGSAFWSELSVAPVRDAEGRITHYVAIINDISDRKHYQDKLEHQANHDALTGLANRSLLMDRLEQNLIYAKRSGRIVAVLLLDLDRFKVINDSLGHGHGDALLQMVATRLNGCVRPGDTVSRLGGDEFVVALAEIAELDDIGLLAKRIREKLAEPFPLAGHDLRVTTSIGISLYPKDGKGVDEMVRHADMAMYRAKAEGGDTFCFFAPEMNARIQGTLELEADLRLGLDRGEFLLHYQPQVDFASGRISGCEALLRWQHPRRGLVSPGDFIPLAEETGLIVPLGEWVLKEACAQAKAWQEAGLPSIKVAVNLSARQFRQARLIEQVEMALHETGLAPTMLYLELTESMIMHDVAGAAEIMHHLANLGVGLCLDDFGTGYSSLNYLRRFPVNYLKIDRSFITDVTSDPSGAAVTTSIVAIAHSLGIGAIAEGVETREQFDFLADCGCDAFQGYLFSKPLPAEEFADLLQEALPCKIPAF